MRVPGLAGVAVVITACGGGGDGGGGTQPPPQVASVVITSPTSAQTISPCGQVSFSAQARDNQGSAIANAPITWTTSDQAKVSLSTASGNSTTASGGGIGSSTITAKSGTISSTGLTVTVAGGNAPASADVSAPAGTAFSPSCVTIAGGGTVTWTFGAQHNVTFTGAKPPQGDIPDQSTGSVSRTFPAAGTYPYHCTLHNGMNGTVIVQ